MISLSLPLAPMLSCLEQRKLLLVMDRFQIVHLRDYLKLSLPLHEAILKVTSDLYVYNKIRNYTFLAMS